MALPYGYAATLTKDGDGSFTITDRGVVHPVEGKIQDGVTYNLQAVVTRLADGLSTKLDFTLLGAPGAPVTLGTLTLGNLNAISDTEWVSSIGGKTAFSTVYAESDDGTQLEVDNASSTVSGVFPNEGSFNVTLTEVRAGAVNSPNTSPSQLVVVTGAPVLGVLSLSGPLQIGTETSGTIIGATIGSTIVSNVPGITVNSAERTYSGTPTGDPGTINNGLVETLEGAFGSPKNTAIVVDPIVLGTLTLSGALAQGAATSGTIIGASAGSTIIGNIPGITVNSGARTYTGTPSSSGTFANGLVETLSGATGSPKNNSITVNAAAALGTLTLDGTLKRGVAVTNMPILGATPGSTITINIPGMTVNSGARTVSGTPTSIQTYANGLVETLGGYTGSPKDNAIPVTFGNDEAAALYARDNTIASTAARRNLLDDVWTAWKAESTLVAKMQDTRHCVQLWASATASAALLNWGNTSNNGSVVAGSPTFYADRGYGTDGVDDVVTTGWSPSKLASINSGFMGAWQRWRDQKTTATIGSGTAVNFSLTSRSTADKISGRWGQSGSIATTTSFTDGFSFCGIQAEAATPGQKQFWRNGAAIDSKITSSTASTNATVEINQGRYNSTANIQNQILAFVGISELTSAEHVALYNGINTWLTGLGVAGVSLAGANAEAITITPTNTDLPEVTGGENPEDPGAGFPNTGLAKIGTNTYSGWGLGGIYNKAGIVVQAAASPGAYSAYYRTDTMGAALGLTGAQTGAAGTYPILSSTQGCAPGPDSKLYYVAKDSTNGFAMLGIMNTGGTLDSLRPLPSANINCLAYDSLRGRWLCLNNSSSAVSVCTIDGSGNLTIVSTLIASTRSASDTIFYVPELDWLCVTGGPNAVDGDYILAFPLSGDYGGPYARYLCTVAGQGSMEGGFANVGAISGGEYPVVFVANQDKGTHGGPGDKNVRSTFASVNLKAA